MDTTIYGQFDTWSEEQGRTFLKSLWGRLSVKFYKCKVAWEYELCIQYSLFLWHFRREERVYKRADIIYTIGIKVL